MVRGVVDTATISPLDQGAVLSHYHAMNNNDERPVYLRLRDNIAATILEGKVADGDPLPSVRSLAAEHGANPLTVAKAYQTFQDEGLIVVKRGVGMFVAPGAAARLRASERKDFLENRWPDIAAHIRRLGLDADDLVERATA
jgi:GntR family transcriptional regulator